MNIFVNKEKDFNFETVVMVASLMGNAGGQIWNGFKYDYFEGSSVFSVDYDNNTYIAPITSRAMYNSIKEETLQIKVDSESLITAIQECKGLSTELKSELITALENYSKEGYTFFINKEIAFNSESKKYLKNY